MFHKEKKGNQKKIVGVYSLNSLDETLKFSIPLAITARNSCYKEVVLLEMGNRHDVSKIRRFFAAKLLTSKGDFQLDGMKFVPDATIQEAEHWAAKDNVYLILDCGNLEELWDEINKMCYEKITFCSMIEWKIDATSRYLQEKGVGIGGIFMVTEGKHNIQQIKKKTNLKIRPWELINDPFCINRETLSEMYRMFCV